MLVEPVSLAIGAVSLASLFSLCVQCFDLIEVGGSLGEDYELLIVKLSIEKRRLMIWGESVGILRPDQDRDELLDDPKTHQLVERILMNIQRLFHDADALRSKYGLEKALDKSPIPKAKIDGSTICYSLFENSPLVQFQKRVSEFHQTAGLMTKTRWAIRDNGKFTKLITSLKDLLDGLHQITTSARTSILKGHLIRQETETISDLRTLKIIEESCSDADWKSCAGAASSYLTSLASVNVPKREYVDEWIKNSHDRESSPQMQVATGSGPWVHQKSRVNYRSASPRSLDYDDQPTENRAESRTRNDHTLQRLNRPHGGSCNAEVLVMCSTSTLVAWVSSSGYFHPIRDPPKTTRANQMTYSRVMKAIRIPPNVSFPHITIYCPPRMRYVHMALRFVGLESQAALEYRCQIRFDDRLLDRTTSFEGIMQRMKGYYQELEEAYDTENPTLRRLVDAIDMNWLEQRIDCLTQPFYQPLTDTLDWYTIFRQSKDDADCVGIIILSGDETCRTLFNTAPVIPPDNFRGEGRVYRLRELEGANDESEFRWKAEHCCNISMDKDFENLLRASKES